MSLTKEQVEALGYEHVRQLEDGAWVGIKQMIYTTAIVVDIGPVYYDHRFCFVELGDALREIERMRTIDDDPVGYVKRKPE